MSVPLNVWLGFGLAVLISLAAYRLRSLSTQGALTATILGTVIFGLGGLGWAALLLAFFISSSALSKLFKRQKAALEEKFSKGARRDAAQVLANGGIAGLFVVAHAIWPETAWPWAAFAGALAAANADTWATELGVLSNSPPRMITTRQPVERGTSGGISRTGTLAALGGALLVALLAVIFWQGRVSGLYMNSPAWLAQLLGSTSTPIPLLSRLLWLAWIAFCGLAGSLLDSWLGATAQAIYYCPNCGKETERHPLHTCGNRTTHLRGLEWLNNDVVNLFCTLLGALLAIIPALVR